MNSRRRSLVASTSLWHLRGLVVLSWKQNATFAKQRRSVAIFMFCVLIWADTRLPFTRASLRIFKLNNHLDRYLIIFLKYRLRHLLSTGTGILSIYFRKMDPFLRVGTLTSKGAYHLPRVKQRRFYCRQHYQQWRNPTALDAHSTTVQRLTVPLNDTTRRTSAYHILPKVLTTTSSLVYRHWYIIFDTRKKMLRN